MYEKLPTNAPQDRGCGMSGMAHIQNCYTDDPEAEHARAEEVIQHQVDELSADPLKPLNGMGPEVYIGFDSEFISGGKDRDNTVLSLQFYLVGERGSFQKIVYPDGNAKAERPTFAKTLTRILLDAMEAGVILEWPSRVVICGFFLRIDLPAFGDLAAFKTQLSSAGGRIASIDSDVSVELDPRDIESLLSPKTFVASDAVGMCRLLRVRFVDVGSHVAVGTSLAQMGDLIGLPKLLIPEGHSIERMDVLLAENKPAFEAYGIRDAEIAVRYYLKLLAFAESVAGRQTLPATASGLAVKIFLKTLHDAGTDFKSAFGTRVIAETYWNKNSGNVVTRKNEVPNEMRSIIEPFVTSCYNGGRNECYAFGPTVIGVWNDFDLAGAYTTGLVDLRHIDYENFRVTKTPEDFIGHVLGFALVNFEFPEDTRFPSLPVRSSNNGLFYPLCGSSYCTAPEIEVALRQGCKITIKHGLVIPWVDGDNRLFEPYVTWIRKLRNSYEKGSIDELYAKLLGNSLYGKTAQGLKKKTVFDTGRMTSVELPHSEITNAIIAAHTTGFIRAVLSEQIAGVPLHRKVISATTDGFITDADESELSLDGPMAIRFQALCDRVSPGSKMLERKHRVKQLVAMKTRGQLTGLAYGNDPVVLAKAGVSPNVPADQHNDFMLNLFVNRKPGDITQTRPFTPIREQWIKNADVVRITRDIRLNLEFDCKRRLIDPLVISVANTDHIYLDSVPWSSVEEGERARAHFDGWRRKRCLKTLDDWQDWQEHYLFASVRDRQIARGDKSFGIRNTGNGLTDLLRRLFLRAYTQELCGLAKTMTYSQLASWLTEQGFPTTCDEVKNAKRSKFVVRAIPATERTLLLAGLLQKHFPSLDIDQLVATDCISTLEPGKETAMG